MGTSEILNEMERASQKLDQQDLVEYCNRMEQNLAAIQSMIENTCDQENIRSELVTMGAHILHVIQMIDAKRKAPFVMSNPLSPLDVKKIVFPEIPVTPPIMPLIPKGPMDEGSMIVMYGCPPYGNQR